MSRPAPAAHADLLAAAGRPLVARAGLGTAARRRLAARAGLSLLRANLLYWSGVSPAVRSHLARWRRAAVAMPESASRVLALRKLDEERFNVEVAATLATLAERRSREAVVQAIVALQVAYDYLDLLTETPAWRGENARLPLSSLLDAVDLDSRPDAAHRPRADLDRRAHLDLDADLDRDADLDCRAALDRDARAGRAYLDSLVHAVSSSFERLPSASRIAPVAIRSAKRCVEGQAYAHAALDEAGEQGLRRWAQREAAQGPLGWRELAAGASASVLCLHALISAAAQPAVITDDAVALDRLYLSIGALTMLDSLIDAQQDRDRGQRGHLARYADPRAMGDALAAVAREGLAEAESLPHRAHHAMTLAGVVGYYASAPTAAAPPARAAIEQLRGELGPLLSPPLAVMRAWRTAKRLRRRLVWAAAIAAIAGALVAPLAYARVLHATDRASLRYVSASGSTLYEVGHAAGTLPGAMHVHMRIGASFSGSFTIYASGGAIEGRGKATPHGSGVWESFAGTITVSGGSGRYRHAHGRAGLYGTFNRNTYALVVETTGSLRY